MKAKHRMLYASIRGLAAAGLLLCLLAAPTVRAQSIFEDGGWEDPEMEAPPKPDRTTKGPKPPKIDRPQVDDEPQQQPDEPENTDNPAAPTEQPTEDPGKPSLSKLFPDPKAKVKEIDAQLRELGMKLDNDKVVHLLHTKAVCLVMQGNLPAARKVMDVVLKSKFTNRSIVINASKLDVSTNINSVRASLNLEALLRKDPKDEAAFDLFGASLAAIAKRNKGKKVLVPVEKVAAYEEFLAAVEQTKPGQRRWGNQWMESGEYDRLMRERQDRLRDVERAWQEYARARDHADYVIRTTIPQRVGRRRRQYSEYQIRTINEAKAAANEKYELVRQARARLPRPKFTYSMMPEIPDPALQLEQPLKKPATASAKASSVR